MVAGVPNIGKSTVLNRLRYECGYQGHVRKKIQKTEKFAGTTRRLDVFFKYLVFQIFRIAIIIYDGYSRNI